MNKRILAYFAVDHHQRMATVIDRDKTPFLPFNQGATVQVMMAAQATRPQLMAIM